ncbi:DUF2470 domain-containing protein [Streptomyces sp. NPDC059009]|uniref:DUF2470 domain-containing protein n=1 Tax=Streptomyces sp. NPDC059009 TaxID=3346694 RepID=UPI003680EB28
MAVRPTSTTTTEPTAAERARSVLATAWSCSVTTEYGKDELVGAHSVTAEGTLRLHAPQDSALSAAVLCAPRGEPSTLLEFADVAPVPVRERVRARLWLSGELVPDGDCFLLKPVRAVLHETASGREGIDLVQLALATPDPLAEAESRLLTHLADAHADAVEQLTRLITPESLQGVVRVRPLAVDRFGLTLRLERARSQADVRLPFHVPVEDVAEVTDRMHVLLSAASSRRRPVLRATPPEA